MGASIGQILFGLWNRSSLKISGRLFWLVALLGYEVNEKSRRLMIPLVNFAVNKISIYFDCLDGMKWV